MRSKGACCSWGTAALLWQELEGVDVTGADDAEVAAVQCGDLRFVEAFRDGDYGRVDQADILIGVFGTKLNYSPVVFHGQRLHADGALGDIAEEGQVNVRIKTTTYEVVNLNDHRRRNNERFLRSAEKVQTRAMIILVAIKGCEERA